MDKMNSYDFHPFQIGFITECVEPVSGVMPVRDVLGYFDGNPDLDAVPVELESGYGILSREYLERKKISLLNMSKSLSSLDILQENDGNFNSRENVQKIFRELTGSDGEEVPFHIVYHNNNLFGLVHLRNIIRHVSDLQAQEVGHARGIQQRLLEKNLIQDPAFQVQAGIRWANELGGDYYFSAKITDFLSMVSCFDIAGEHVTASLVSVMIDSYFKTRKLMDNMEKEDVEKLILSLNSFLLEQTAGTCPVSGVFLFIRKDEKKVVLYNFGYSSPFMVLSEEGKIRAKMVPAQYAPLGVEDIVILREEPVVFDLASLKSIFIYSDGIEGCANPFGERFGFDRIKDCVVQNYKTLGSGFNRILNEEIDEFRHNAPLTDDITSMVISFS